MPGLSRAELERTARERRAEPPRVTLARIVRKASIESKDEAEFVRRLRDSRVLVRPRFGTGGQDTVVGFSVALKTTVGEPPVWFGGGKLSRDLTLSNLRQSWDRTAAVAAWSAAKTLTPGREAIIGDPDDWIRAVAGAERSVERLMAIPASDLAAWRGAAREAAGVFAAWSRRFEGDSPGPMAHASDALGRSAQYRRDDPVPPREAVRDFRGIAGIVAQSALDKDSPKAWAALVDQLAKTLRAVGNAHEARGEVEAAKALCGHLSDELAGLHDHFLTSTPHKLVPGEQIQGTWLAFPARGVEVYEDIYEAHGRHGVSHDHGFER